jgi:hypothetical protein
MGCNGMCESTSRNQAAGSTLQRLPTESNPGRFQSGWRPLGDFRLGNAEALQHRIRNTQRQRYLFASQQFRYTEADYAATLTSCLPTN